MSREIFQKRYNRRKVGVAGIAVGVTIGEAILGRALFKFYSGGRNASLPVQLEPKPVEKTKTPPTEREQFNYFVAKYINTGNEPSFWDSLTNASTADFAQNVILNRDNNDSYDFMMRWPPDASVSVVESPTITYESSLNFFDGEAQVDFRRLRLRLSPDGTIDSVRENPAEDRFIKPGLSLQALEQFVNRDYFMSLEDFGVQIAPDGTLEYASAGKTQGKIDSFVSLHPTGDITITERVHKGPRAPITM